MKLGSGQPWSRLRSRPHQRVVGHLHSPGTSHSHSHHVGVTQGGEDGDGGSHVRSGAQAVRPSWRSCPLRLRPTPLWTLGDLGRRSTMTALKAVRPTCHLSDRSPPAPGPSHPLLPVDLRGHGRQADLLSGGLILLVVVQVRGEARLVVGELAVAVDAALALTALVGDLLPGGLSQPRSGGSLALTSAGCSTSRTLPVLLLWGRSSTSPFGRRWA